MNHRRGIKANPCYDDKIRESIDAYNLAAVRIFVGTRTLEYVRAYTICKEYCSAIRKDRRIPAVHGLGT